MPVNKIIVDANEAVADIAYRLNEVIAIYPITPASPMGEWSDVWSAHRQPNLYGTVPTVIEMQSEGGAAGVVHGSLQNGALTTTFTASQGLLLMIPNMYKIAGELTSMVMHVAARTVATHALSIFCDHGDVMATRGTGFALLCSNSVQEAMDFAVIAQQATLASRVPFIHFFDGFRTSHELMDVQTITDSTLLEMVSPALIRAHRRRALTPEAPFIRGTAQNPDVFFQAREASNPFYLACPGHVSAAMDAFGRLTGRSYKLADYYGDPEAEHVIIMMGSGVETVKEVIDVLNADGAKTGILSIRLYRPFPTEAIVNALPATVKRITVLDRTKEPGAAGEPLYQDIITTLHEAIHGGECPLLFDPDVVGGRYGLSSKEFTPPMVTSVFENMQADRPRNHFTVGINDDVTGLSLPVAETTALPAGTPARDTKQTTHSAVFYGLGSDGTVSANKNSIKIIGDHTDYHTQGYFVYDSKKSGSMTTSHLRFSTKPIRSAYLITRADFVACHQPQFLDRFDMVSNLREGGTFLVNHPSPADQLWQTLPAAVRTQIREKKIRLFCIDAETVARDAGMGNRINTVMQACFFAIAEVLPKAKAIKAIKDGISKTYGKRGEKIIAMNFKAVDSALSHLHEITIPPAGARNAEQEHTETDLTHNYADADEFVREVTRKIISGGGDTLPVSAFTPDGTFPSATTRVEKRCISTEAPVWDPEICIQCGKCALVCPHAVIRIKAYDKALLDAAPKGFKFTSVRGKDWPENTAYTISVSTEDCTGCSLCVEVCPAKDKTNTAHKALDMMPMAPTMPTDRAGWDFFLTIPEADRSVLKADTVKGSQFLQPLFEFSGACAGCGETPYVKLITQLFGDRMLVANATGCSSIYGGNLPTTPWAKNKDGRGPAWSNSLFEDNAEFGLGYRVAVDKKREQALELVVKLKKTIGTDLADAILTNVQESEADIHTQRESVARLKEKLAAANTPEAESLTDLADYLVKRSVWIVGGDGWAYDIGFGGLDHVMASGRNVNILVLDTEVYSNTGGQMSKATPLGAVAKFAAGGKQHPKKDLALQAVTYGSVYVARIAMGANDTQTVKTLIEAEKFDGPSIVIAYSHCIAHGYDMKNGLTQQKLAVESGYWPLFRYNPDRLAAGLNPFQLDSRKPSIAFREYAYNETRYHMLSKIDPKAALDLMHRAQESVDTRWKWYENLAAFYEPKKENEA